MSLELLQKLKKQSKLDRVNILSKSDMFNRREPIPTEIPILNIVMGASLKGGIEPGLTQWAGPSKHFKTSFMLLSLKTFLNNDPDSVAVWFDSEFGSPQSYFSAFGINPDRILHVPITNIEELKFELMNQLETISRGDKIMLCVDSIGNLASKKEIEDALKESSAADMTRAKQLKSLFRMVTPILSMKELPMHVVNHTYKTMELYAKDVVGGGTGSYYSANNIYIIGRQQEKGTDEIEGYHFIINIEKSRIVKEKKKFSITVLYDKGIGKYSGLLELGLLSGYVVKPKNGWYARVNKETGEIEEKNWREKQTHSKEFWSGILADPKFEEWIKNEYAISANEMMVSEEDIENHLSEMEGQELNLVTDHE